MRFKSVLLILVFFVTPFPLDAKEQINYGNDFITGEGCKKILTNPTLNLAPLSKSEINFLKEENKTRASQNVNLPLLDGVIRGTKTTTKNVSQEHAKEASETLLLDKSQIIICELVQVKDAHAIRAKISDLSHIEGVAIFTYGSTISRQVNISSDFKLEDGLWTPVIGGGKMWIEIHIPLENKTTNFQYRVSHVNTLLSPAQISGKTDETDSSITSDPSYPGCIGGFPNQIRLFGTTRLTTIIRGQSFACSGSLVKVKNGHLLVLTANHCVPDNTTAGTVDSYWSYFRKCNAPKPPDISKIPRASGSRLLEAGTSPSSGSGYDFSLIEILEQPTPKALLFAMPTNWSRGGPTRAEGSKMNIFSHPFGGEMRVSMQSWEIDFGLEPPYCPPRTKPGDPDCIQHPAPAPCATQFMFIAKGRIIMEPTKVVVVRLSCLEKITSFLGYTREVVLLPFIMFL